MKEIVFKFDKDGKLELPYPKLEVTSTNTLFLLKTFKSSATAAIGKFFGGVDLVFQYMSDGEFAIKLRMTKQLQELLKANKEQQLLFWIEFHELDHNGQCHITKTETLSMSFDLKKIFIDESELYKNEIYELSAKMNSIAKKINDINLNKPILNIEGIKGVALPGMVPVVEDTTGQLRFDFPFSSFISEVNGKKGIGGSLELNTDDIKHEGRSTKDTLNSLNKGINDLTYVVSAITSRINRLEEIVEELGGAD